MATFDQLTSIAAGVLRGGAGARAVALGPRPVEPVRLWEFEGCPFCRKVREALSMLEIDARVHPCPKGGTRFRDELRARGVALRFPYLEDPNAGDRAMHESDAIVGYLFATYGAGPVPLALRLGPLTTLSSGLVSAMRRRGGRARASRAPRQLLELHGNEGDAGTRLVREVLCELELTHLSRATPRGGTRSDQAASLPYLVDADAGVSLRGAAPIVMHLERTYADATGTRSR